MQCDSRNDKTSVANPDSQKPAKCIQRLAAVKLSEAWHEDAEDCRDTPLWRIDRLRRQEKALRNRRTNGAIIALLNRCVELRGPFPGRLPASKRPEVWQQSRQPVGRSGWKPPANHR
jgi:hypothetical protein